MKERPDPGSKDQEEEYPKFGLLDQVLIIQLYIAESLYAAHGIAVVGINEYNHFPLISEGPGKHWALL